MNSKFTHIHHDLINISLDKVEGFPFERFSQDFLSALEGFNFIPVGGQSDGGADGIYASEQGRIFYQFTVQENHRDKIRKTVRRLKEFGRDLSTLYYLTSKSIPHIDKEEDSLSDELNIRVKIRDRKYICSHINDTIGTVNSYHNHLSTYTNYLANIAVSQEHIKSAHVKDPSVFVFLQHEVTNRRNDRKLIHSLTDSLILWSLSETDPDKGIFMSESELTQKIFTQFPWATKILKGHITQRLTILRSKNNSSGREIRWYGKAKKYCLPYETRHTIKEENQVDEGLKVRFIDEVKFIVSKLFDADDGEYQKIANISLNVIHLIFEKQGLLFSSFLSSDDKSSPPTVASDCIDTEINKSGIPKELIENYRDYIESTIRTVFYHSTPCQREFLSNLSRTYVLLFTLQAEPRVVEYFSAMSSSFNLFLGSDILVKALSERYLDEENQVARNLLKMSSAAGINMLLSENVLGELYTHIRGTNYEFINYFAQSENFITNEIARNSNKILIRSYFYAKNEGKVRGWRTFIDQFISYSNIENGLGKEELKKYLSSEYGLIFVENSELESVCSPEAVKALSDAMLSADDKKNEVLSYNTALQVYGIYGLRRKNKESSRNIEYGFKTWWMTNQSRVIRHTIDVIKSQGAKYIMRPEYILNFIAMSPNCEQVRKSFNSTFPSAFGIQLGHRLKDDVFHKVMSDVAQWKGYEEGRIIALVSDLSDKLKTDRLKRYEHVISDTEID